MGVVALAAETSERQPLFPAQSAVVLLAGLPGDVESESTYRDQLQSWLEIVGGSGQAAKIFVLCDNPESMIWAADREDEHSQSPAEQSPDHPPPVTRHQALVTVLHADRTNFLSLNQSLAGGTNPLVLIAWGHGGRQGNTPVFHVRGPRITAADFKALANDTEELLRATANQTGERVSAARARLEERLQTTRAKLEELQEDAIERARAAAHATDKMVHDNPWQSVGVAAAIGFFLGWLSGRR